MSKMPQETPAYRAPRIAAAQVKLLERLCNASGVSGDEGQVRKIVLELVRPLADEVKVDALGNVLVTRRGKTPGTHLRVMLAAHMDEVGLMITNDEGDGIYRFDTVGGIDARVLVGKAVWIGGERVPGVIGAKAIHLTQSDELKRPITLDTLRIDVGLGGAKVKAGDRVVFATPFSRVGPSLRGKAIDDRIGVATLVELLKHAPENVDLLLAFTVQEEIGARGARVAAYYFKPDLAFAIDSTPAHDLPTWDESENTQYNTRLGAGPAIYIADSGTLSDPRIVRHLLQTADELHIPCQIRQPGGGGTDASAIHKQLTGIPSVSVSVPGRHAHTPILISRLDDWQNTLALLHAALVYMPADLLMLER
jgi:endoglucanase